MRRLLADTHVLIWALDAPERLPKAVRDELDAADLEPLFSVISIWEIAIKAGLGRASFSVDPRQVRAQLLDDGWGELGFDSDHAIAAGALPRHNTDPFDRALVAQARLERIDLVTDDRRLGEYGASIRLI